MASKVIFAIICILIPALIIWLNYKFKFFKKIGIVLICYIAGMIIGNVGILPNGIVGVQGNIQSITVALALPMLMFSLDVKGWLKSAKSSLFCMFLAVVAIVVTTFALQIAMGHSLQDCWKIAGMACAVYTGGTPNLVAMKVPLHVDNNTFILFNTYDTVFSLIYIVFMATVARTFFQKVFKLKPYKPVGIQDNPDATQISDESVETYLRLLKRTAIKGVGLALLLSLGIVAITLIAGMIFPVCNDSAVSILIITTLGIAASFIEPVRKIKYTFNAGMYIVYIFCFTVATTTSIKALTNINWNLMIYDIIAIFGSMLIHAALCKLSKIDSDTMIITSVSAICSPPFVPVVASGLKNREILISGVITGLIGYAIANYLGIGIALFYHIMFK